MARGCEGLELRRLLRGTVFIGIIIIVGGTLRKASGDWNFSRRGFCRAAYARLLCATRLEDRHIDPYDVLWSGVIISGLLIGFTTFNTSPRRATFEHALMGGSLSLTRSSPTFTGSLLGGAWLLYLLPSVLVLGTYCACID